MNSLQHEQRRRLERIAAGDFFDARCGHCTCDASPEHLKACAEQLLQLAAGIGDQADAAKNIADFKKELAEMPEIDRALVLLARGEVLEILRRFPGAGLMAIAYVCAEEASKIPDQEGPPT